MYHLYVGADISAKTVDFHWQHIPSDKHGHRHIKQCASGYRTIISRLLELAEPSQIFVVMEATGTYWLQLALALHDAHIAVSVINPRSSYHFARYKLKRTKTDKVDAQLLSLMAQDPTEQFDLWTPPPAIYHQLSQTVTLRQNLVDSRTQYRNRLHALQQNPYALPDTLDSIQQIIHYFDEQIDQLTIELQDLLQHDHQWYDAAQRLLSIPSISTITATWILVATHAFDRCDTPEQAASFAGLAPHHQSSGQRQGKAKTGGGHQRLRSILYMAAGNAIQKNPIIKTFNQRLLKHGKIKNVARVASARKLLHIAWACVTKQRDFDPNYRQHPKVA